MSDTLYPQRTPGSFSRDYLREIFVIQQLIGRLITIVPVEVLDVTGAGSLASCPYVTVQPLLKQVTGNGVGVDHGPVYNVPCVRWQAGSAAIVLDPAVGDVGLLLCSYRDTAALVAADQDDPGSLQGGDDTYNPGSAAQHDFGSGFYLGGMLNGAVAQYLQLTASAAKLRAPNLDLNTVTIDSSGNLSAHTLAAANGSTGVIAIENSTTTITVQNGIITGHT